MFSLVWDHWDNQEQTCVVTAASVGRQGNLTTCVQKGQCQSSQPFLCSLHPERNMRAFTASSPLSFIASASFLTRYYVTFTLAHVLEILASKLCIWMPPSLGAWMSHNRFSAYICRQNNPKKMKGGIGKV